MKMGRISEFCLQDGICVPIRKIKTLYMLLIHCKESLSCQRIYSRLEVSSSV
jgi:hypothetical protein